MEMQRTALQQTDLRRLNERIRLTKGLIRSDHHAINDVAISTKPVETG